MITYEFMFTQEQNLGTFDDLAAADALVLTGARPIL